MRYKLYFTLENETFPIDYRRNIISWIKLALSEYNEENYKKFYNNKNCIIKPFSFSAFFKNPEILKDKINVQDKKFELIITIANYETAIILYNSFNHQKNKKFPINKNSWTLKNISMMLEKEIKTEEIIVKFLSPLCARSRAEQKDYYYSFNDEKFLETLKINIKQQLKITNIPKNLADDFNIEAINPKKTVIKFYEKQIECSLGVYKISGNKELLNYLYKAGLGSKHSARFWDVPGYRIGGEKIEDKNIFKRLVF